LKSILKYLISLLIIFSIFYCWILPLFSQNTIFINGKIITMDLNQNEFEAVYIKNGLISHIGSDEEIIKYNDWKTKVINLEGKTMMPGFIEAHCHPIGTAIIDQVLNISGYNYNSRADIIDEIKNEIENSNSDDWLIVFGWDPVMVDDLENPTLSELDEISPNRPLLILTQMMHHGFINSAGYKRARITTDFPKLSGAGKFLKDENGELNGIIYEVTALQYILKQLPKTPSSAIQLLLNIQYSKYAKAGFTSIGVLGPIEKGGYPLDFMYNLASQKNMPIRTFIYGLENQVDSANWAPNYGHDKFRLKGVKLYMDGSPYTGGAAFKEAYENSNITLNRIGLKPNHFGEVNYNLDKFIPLVEKYHNQGFQIAIHVQGENAIDIALDAIEIALNKHPRLNHRHRLEHNALITTEQIKRSQKLGVTLSIFIDHIYYYGDKLNQIVGDKRTQRYMPLGTAMELGNYTTIHTDNPVTPVNALRPVETAILRQARKTEQIVGKDEIISTFDAFKAITINPAWQFFEENNIGSLEIGKFADIVILSENPFEINTERYQEINIESTWLSGKKVNTSIINWTNFKLSILSIWEMI
jgi:predicted amidohydrolase YtcJ